MDGQQRIKLINHPKLFAAEATDFDDEVKRQNRKRAVDLLDGTDHDYKRKLAVYQASDNPNLGEHGHSLEGIGTRCAYFKLERINLEGLLQCFHDSDVRIRQDFEFVLGRFAHIKQIKISSGFLDGQVVHFHAGLNSILGAKGTGKSLLIELLRFGLGQPPLHSDIYKDHISKLQVRLGEYGFVEIKILDEMGVEHNIKRTFTSYGDNPFDVPYDPAQAFPVLFLSQNEIIKIAEDTEKQLNFIDSFFDFQTYRSNIQKIEKQLEELDKRMADGIRAIPEVEALNTNIKTLELELSNLDTQLESEVFQKYNLIRQKNQMIADQTKYLSSLRHLTVSLRAKADDKELPQIPSELTGDPILKRNHDVIFKAKQAVALQIAQLEKSLRTYAQNLEIEKTAWQAVYEQAEQEYESYIQQAGGDYKALAAQREKKTRHLEQLKAQLSIQQKRKDSTGDISKQRDRLLDELEQVYQTYTEARQEKTRKFEESSGGRLKITIQGSSNADEFRIRLLELKQGSFLRESEIEAICEQVKPRDFIITLLRYSAAVASKLDKPESKLEEVQKASKINLPKLAKLADFLTNAIDPEKLLELQYKAHPQDRPEIKFNIGGNVFEPLDAISIGQKSTALLIMALSDGIMPIVIDQPEDSLDIKSIWEDICRKLRDGKEKRQFIFTTHNASVAVASDSDYFIVMEGSATHGKVIHSGSMDHDPISEEVLTYLEGGVETYRRKFAKYRGENRLNNI